MDKLVLQGMLMQSVTKEYERKKLLVQKGDKVDCVFTLIARYGIHIFFRSSGDV